MSALALAVATLALTAPGPASPTAPARGAELVPDPSFVGGTEGWTLNAAERVEVDDASGGVAVRLDAAGPDASAYLGLTVEAPPAGRELAVRVRVRGARAEGQAVAVNAFGYDGRGTLLDSDAASFHVEGPDWTELRTTHAVPAGCARWTLWIVSTADAPLYVSDASVVVGDVVATEARLLGGPGVLWATAGTFVRPSADGAGGPGTVTFPIPGTHAEQLPLTFDVDVEPADAYRGFRWLQRDDGENWLCEVEVEPPASGAAVSWAAYVLVADRAPRVLPRAVEPEVHELAEPWLDATACVQSDDAGIAAKARELHAEAGDLEAYVEAVIAFTSRHAGSPDVPFDALDARKALACGGSCTSRANLAAALLRARGIAARTQAHLPAWYEGELYQHWLVEYWHPGAGWVWVEPTLGVMQPSQASLVVLNVANPADEDRAFHPSIARSGVMPGVADLAVHKLSPSLEPILGQAPIEAGFAGNRARAALPVGDSFGELFQLAYGAYLDLRRRGLAGELDRARTTRITAAVEAGDVDALRAALAR